MARGRKKKVTNQEVTENQAQEIADKSSEVYELARNNKKGLCLIPARKVAGNPHVEAVEPEIIKDGLQVCKRILTD